MKSLHDMDTAGYINEGTHYYLLSPKLKTESTCLRKTVNDSIVVKPHTTLLILIYICRLREVASVLSKVSLFYRF